MTRPVMNLDTLIGPMTIETGRGLSVREYARRELARELRRQLLATAAANRREAKARPKGPGRDWMESRAQAFEDAARNVAPRAMRATRGR